MTALDLDRLEALALSLGANPRAWDRAYLESETPYMTPRAAVLDLVSEVRRLAAESEARRLVLVLKATELRQAEAAVERLKSERDEARATLEKETELIQFERMLSEEERKKAYRSSQPEMAEYLLTCEHEWRKTADKLSDRCDERDRALARAERAEEALRATTRELECIAQQATSLADTHAALGAVVRADFRSFAVSARRVLSPLPAPQPDPEVEP